MNKIFFSLIALYRIYFIQHHIFAKIGSASLIKVSTAISFFNILGVLIIINNYCKKILASYVVKFFESSSIFNQKYLA